MLEIFRFPFENSRIQKKSCFTVQFFTRGREWDHSKIKNHFISWHKSLSPLFKELFFPSSLCISFQRKFKTSKKERERRERERELSHFIYLFSGVVFGQLQFPKIATPSNLWFGWIELGKPDLGTHPTPTIINVIL